MNLFTYRKLALALTVLCFAQGARAAEVARTTESFVDSIGVCTHWTYPDTPYGYAYAQVKQALVASGIRHIRDGFNPHLAELAQLGIRTTVVAEPESGSPVEIKDKIKAINRGGVIVEAVEGPNEPDLFWVKNKKNYGLLRRDLTPKPAYTALQNLIRLLSDPKGKPGFRPGSLDFHLEVKPAGEYNKTQVPASTAPSATH